MTTAALQLRRILHVLPRLADGEVHRIDDILAEAGVDQDTLLRDLHQITERRDEPAGFVDGVQVQLAGETVVVVTSHFCRPLRITASELCALELGLAMLAAERPEEERPTIERARERLRKAIMKLPPDEPSWSAGLHASVGDGRQVDRLATVRAAMRARRKLRIAYRRGGGAAATERAVCPYSLVFATGMWYIVAHCEQSEGLRIFRLDRVDALSTTDEPYQITPGFSPDALLRDDRLFLAEQPRTMTVRYSPRIARWIAEREGGLLAADGSLTVEHPLADSEWGVRHVLQYGGDAEVLGPLEVREMVVGRVRRIVDGSGE